ncbi:guanylin [Fukomys damarensis]|uniref:Guanylin n=1 Tax=Fukomys damarensis TaxID=885580 RepID=A0A091E5B6_FUKDA|nr:guanylin [Fukomys damarensis]KFO37735.1 Guanylin [Fukomys damarensis]
MNGFLLSVLCLLGAWAALAGGVTVQDGDFSFSLESVKRLRDLREIREPTVEGRRKLAAPQPLCSHPGFPEELRPVCREPNVRDILRRLEAIAQDPSTCEICAYAACAGC